MSEHLSGQPGIAQVELIQPVETTLPRAPVEASGFFDKIRNKWSTIVAVTAAVVAVTVSPAVEAEPAHAATTRVAEIGMPFDGKWGFGEQANSHAGSPSAHWAQDIYANDAEVRLNASTPNGGSLSFEWVNSWDSCNGNAGKGVRIAVKVDNEKELSANENYLSWSASTAGNLRPAISSRLAPPPVETWLKASVNLRSSM